MRRKDREFLLKIRSGAFSYEELVDLANEKVILIEELYNKSNLPDAPDLQKAEDILVEIREVLYP